jgi:hypothetical protein
MERKWNSLRDCIAKKWVHFFGLCRMKGKRSGKIGLLCGWENDESLLVNCCVF